MSKSGFLNVANMAFNAIPENNILATISQFTVAQDVKWNPSNTILANGKYLLILMWNLLNESMGYLFYYFLSKSIINCQLTRMD